MAKQDYRDKIAEEIIKQIEAGTAPWQKPWDAGVFREAPFNPTTGNNYKGINALYLEMMGYSDPRWLTYKQAGALDAQVRKGEKASQIEYWIWQENQLKTDDTGKPVLDNEGKKQYQKVSLERPKVVYANVFNAAQIDGLEPLQRPEVTFKIDEKAEEILANSVAKINYDRSDRAFYSPASDSIHMPPKEAFKDAYEFYATAIHEVGHSTGHTSRLDRPFGPFGSQDYAKEELRAEISAYMTCSSLGLGHYPERHANYVESWVKVLKEDKHEIFRAAKDAEVIKTWNLEPDKRPELLRQSQARQKGAAMERTVSMVENKALDVKALEGAHAPGDDKIPAQEDKSQSPNKRYYLTVPFEEKDEAKALGARFHKAVKKWYVPDGIDKALLAKWDRPRIDKEPVVSPAEEFTNILVEQGFHIKGSVAMDSEWHRVQVEGDGKGQSSGSYRCFNDENPALQYTNYRLQEKAITRFATGNRKLDSQELAALKGQSEEYRKERNEQRLATEKQVSKKAYAIWMSDKNKPAESHPYLTKKQITAPELKVNEKNQLLVAMKDAKGFIWSLQTITPEGDKYFLKDGRKKGLMAVVGDEKTLTEDKQQVIICEGFATAKSLHDATGLTVVAAFDKGNLKPVIKALQTQNSNLAFIVAGDNDHKLESNPALQKNVGALAAKEAAEMCNGKDIIPVLTDTEKEQGLSDFNDLAVSRGIGEVNKQLKPLISQKTRAQKKDQGQGMIIGM